MIGTQERLEVLARQVRSDIVHMTAVAKSGHIGGPLGFTEALLIGIDSLILNPNKPYDPTGDKVVISGGHYSALVYASIAALGLIPADKHDVMVAKFRALDDVVDGHVSHHFPFIWDSTGHLGYGPAIAAGHAVADRMLGYKYTHILCAMGDGEQTKGPIAESLRFMKKYDLGNVTILVDMNGQQLSGTTESVMPMNVPGNFIENGWEVREAYGDQFISLSSESGIALTKPFNVILAQTVMGNGVKEAAGTHKYHGQPVKDLAAACADLGDENRLEQYAALRASDQTTGFQGRPLFETRVDVGDRIVYTDKMACRAAFGKTLVDIAKRTLNENGTPREGYSPIAVFDCDVASSVNTAGFAQAFPNNFFQAGVQEHSTAVTAGTVSTRGVSTWLAMFGVFGHGMTYNEHMLTAMNDGNLKLVTTHNSIDVGEDGKTHSPTDYLKLSTHGWQTFCPADANQTDAVVRYMAANQGCMHLAVGRSELGIITKQGSNEPFFDVDYVFKPKSFDVLRDYGRDAVIVTYGTPTFRAVKAADALHEDGIEVKVVNVPTPKDLPDEIAAYIAQANMIITFEDHNVDTGVAKEVDSMLLKYHRERENVPMYQRISIGMPADQFSKSAQAEQLYKHFGIHENRLIADIKKALRG